MKILLIGEFSNLHWTLAEGLRELGHEVTVVSEGHSFRAYCRDITIKRKGKGLINSVRYVYDIWNHFQNFKGYDVVQLINPSFLELKPERNLKAFYYLKKYNRKIFLGAFGDDYHWIKTCLDGKTFKYSDFDLHMHPNIPPISQERVDEYMYGIKGEVNQEMAQESDGIIACLYEYYKSYEPYYKEKLVHISLPINTDKLQFKQRGLNPQLMKIFVGIQRRRSIIKGTDVVLEILQDLSLKYKNEIELMVAYDVPYDEYVQIRDSADLLVDQLYSYTPAMNALSAMAQGLVVFSGGEDEYYDFIGETENKPIINAFPSEESIVKSFEDLIANKSNLASLSLKSREFVDTHHNYIEVAKQYVDFWNRS